MTFSIVAADPAAGAVGVAVASRYLAVGAIVPAAMPGVGAVATQADVNPAYGPEGVLLLHDGSSPEDALRTLTQADPRASDRQAGIVALDGRSATFTGDGCYPWAGGVRGDGYAIQGNLLAGAEVVPAMERAWLGSAGAPLAQRLLAALAAGDAAGGDARGRQSAALVVAQEGAGVAGSDVPVDLRVDDHADPVGELARLLAIRDLLQGTTPEEEWLPIAGDVARQLRADLRLVGVDPGPGDGHDDALEAALRRWVGAANLEERWWGGDRIDPVVVGELRRAASVA